MKLATLIRPRVVELAEKPMPRIAHDYVLVRIVLAPMCNEHIAYEQWDFRDRNRPDSLGHEAVGEVVATGRESKFRPGDRVIALCGYPCGGCQMCQLGRYAHCADTENPLERCQSESGECAFAQYIIKPEWLLVPIPGNVSYKHASMACCGMGATFTAMEEAGVSGGATVLVTGLGPVGLGAVVNGVARGARVIAAGATPYRRELALRLGSEEAFDPNTADARQRLRRVTNGNGPDHVLECSARARYQRFGLDAVRRGGTVTFLGESPELSIHIDRDIIQKGITIRGSLDLYLSHAEKMLDVISRTGGLIDTLITHEFPLTEIEKAWCLQVSRQCGKIVLDPWA